MSEQPTGMPILPREGKWNWFDEAEEQVAQSNQANGELNQQELQLIFAKTFNTDDGQIVLRNLMKFLTEVKGFDPALGFHDGAAQGFYMEGMRDMVAYVNRMVERGNNPKGENE